MLSSRVYKFPATAEELAEKPVEDMTIFLDKKVERNHQRIWREYAIDYINIYFVKTEGNCRSFDIIDCGGE